MAETDIKSINGRVVHDATARENAKKAQESADGAVKSVNGAKPDEKGNVQIEVPSGGITGETDPTVPAWAKQTNKPSYNKTEVGLGNVDNVKQYSESNPPPYPVASVNGKTGAVNLGAADVGARPSTWTPTASDVGALPSSTKVPAKTSDLTNDSGFITIAVATLLNYYLKSEVYSKLETYNAAEVDNLIAGLDKRLNAIADSDDETLDQLSEIVSYIKANKSLIDSITTSKVSVVDIVDNLVTSAANKPLSAAQGVVLKRLIDSLTTTKLDADKLNEAINEALAQAKESGEFDGAPGDDYVLTDADKTDIAEEVKASFTTEEWTFTLEDDSTAVKKVVLG